MKRLLILAVSLSLLLPQVALASFDDVSGQHQYANAIQWMQQNGVVEGYSEAQFGQQNQFQGFITEFRPENKINRAEFLKMVFETKAPDWEYQSIELPFSDVNEYAWYNQYVKMAYAKGIVEGYGDGTFKPEAEINFAEAQKIVQEHMFDVEDLYQNGEGFVQCSMPIDRVDQDQWFYKYMFVAEKMCMLNFGSEGIVIGNNVNSAYKITRGDMAELLYRAKTSHDNGFTRFDETMEPLTLLAQNEFFWGDLAVGDEVNGLEVVSIAATIGDNPPHQWNFSAEFAGEIEISGTYSSCATGCMMEGSVLFEPDADGQALLPRMTGQDIHFRFLADSDIDPAVHLGPLGSSGTATIVINRYTFQTSESELGTVASLLEVIEKVQD